MRTFLAWCRSHPWRTALTVVIALGVLTHFYLNGKAEMRWREYKAEAQARGVKFALTDFAGPEIPDAENFGALPMFRTVSAGTGEEPFTFSSDSWPSPSAVNPVKGVRIDWTQWQAAFQSAGYLKDLSGDPVRDTLRGLDHYAPYFKQWSEWRTRPHCRFPYELERGVTMPNPYTGTFLRAAEFFSLRMRAHLKLGDSAAAYADFQEELQAYRMLRDQPTLVNGLVRTSVFDRLSSAVGDGLMDRAWTSRDLLKIEADLAVVQPWDDYRLALSSERGTMNSVCETLISSPRAAHTQLKDALPSSLSDWRGMVAIQLIPKHLIRNNQWRMSRFVDELLARVDSHGNTFDPDLPTPSSPANIGRDFEIYYLAIAGLTTGVYESIERKYLSHAIKLEQLRLACALERFRLARGDFPETLEELVPDFVPRLPVDPYARASFRYQRAAPGSFKLYSVGKDRVDNGGVIDPKRPEGRQADAIWLYSPPSTSH